MKKFHLNLETGEPGECKAVLKCPFASFDEHFDTAKDAMMHYEKLMGSSRVLSTNKKMTAKEKLHIAANSDDPDELIQVFTNGSSRVAKALAGNPNIPNEIAEELLNETGVIRDTLLNNEGLDLSLIDPKKIPLYRGYRSGKLIPEIASNPEITSKQILFFVNDTLNPGYVKNLQSIIENSIFLRNSKKFAEKIITSSLSSIIENINDERVDQKELYEKNEKLGLKGTLDARPLIARYSNDPAMLSRALKDGYYGDVILNPNVSDDNISEMNEIYKKLDNETIERLFYHEKNKNNKEVKEKLASNNPALKTVLKIENFSSSEKEKYNNFIDSIKIANVKNGKTSYTVNKDEIASIDFSEEDFSNVLQSRGIILSEINPNSWSFDSFYR